MITLVAAAAAAAAADIGLGMHHTELQQALQNPAPAGPPEALERHVR